ncbi:MAG: alpha/beta hydrolase [Myxococcales bacterium]|nr:alpha/beta hydrolase [Myxococcales bacterium]
MIGTTTLGAGTHPVVLLNDWMGDHRNYDAVLPLLDLDANTYVFADLRGYGLSRTVAGHHTLEEAASDVIAVLEGLDGPVTLVGHSMSSLVVQQVAVRARTLLRGLVLVAPIASSGMQVPPEVVQWLQAVGRDEAMRAEQLGPRFAERHGPGWARFKLQRFAQSAEPEAAAAYVHMYGTEAVVGPLPADLPVLAVVGAEDDEPFTPQTVGGWLPEQWPGSTLVVCAASGHYPMQEEPVAFAAALDSFVAERRET